MWWGLTPQISQRLKGTSPKKWDGNKGVVLQRYPPTLYLTQEAHYTVFLSPLPQTSFCSPGQYQSALCTFRCTVSKRAWSQSWVQAIPGLLRVCQCLWCSHCAPGNRVWSRCLQGQISVGNSPVPPRQRHIVQSMQLYNTKLTILLIHLLMYVC